MIKKKILLSLALGACLFAEPLHLDELIKKGLLNSPDLKVSKAIFDISKEQSNEADAAYLPQVNLSAEVGAQGSDYGSQTLGTAPAQIVPGSLQTNILGGSISAQQLLYDFGKTGGNMQNFEDLSLAAQASLEQDILNKIFSIKEAYYDLLYFNALIEVDKENIKLNEQQLDRSKRYFEAGIRTKIDVSDARVNLINAQLDMQNTGYEIESSYVSLFKEIGLDTTTEEESVFISTPDLNNIYERLQQLTKAVNTYTQEAYETRPELREYKQLLNSATSIHKQIDGDYYPELYANGDYTVQKVDEDAFAPESQWKASLSLNWNLYSGSRTTAQSEEARINTLKAKADFDNARLRIHQEVSNAYIQVNKQLDTIKLSQSLSQASAEKFDQAQKRYENGLSDYVELQQARQDYINSRAQLAKGYYSYLTAVAQLDRAIGK